MNYTGFMDYLMALLELLLISVLFAGGFTVIGRRYPELSGTRWWTAMFLAGAAHLSMDLLTVFVPRMLTAALLGLGYFGTGTLLLFAARVFPRRRLRPHVILIFVITALLLFAGLYALGQRFYGDGMTLVNVVSLSTYIIAFSLAAVRTLQRAIQRRRILTFLTFLLYLPYISTTVMAVDNQIRKLIGISRPVNTTVLLTATAVFLVGLGLGWAMDLLDDAVDLQRQLAATDPLTGAANRRSFESAVHMQLGKEPAGRMALIVFDLDFFKQVNDRWGHDAGDDVIRNAVGVTREALRDADLVGRLGGEEFAVLLSGTDKAGASSAAERIRSSLERSPTRFGEELISITASFGVSFNNENDTFEEMYRNADTALYAAKDGGRNRVVFHEDLESRS